MTIYVKRGTSVFPQEDAENFSENLEAATYHVERSIFGWFLSRTSDVTGAPQKIYGNVESRADRIINTYKDRLKTGKGTGVLLSGVKGSGKTMLARMISEKMMAENVATIIVGAAVADSDNNAVLDSFIKFMNLIKCPVVVLFDEFEKNFEDKDQAKMLSMFDGTSVSNKLFVLTVNNEFKLNSFMFNRPGRIYYRFSYSGLESDFVSEYLTDNLNDKSLIPDILTKIDKIFSDTFTFDMLQATVEEMNRYNVGFQEALSVLNIDVDSMAYNAKLFKGTKLVGEKKLNHFDHSTTEWVYDKAAEEHVYFSQADFSVMDVAKGCAVLKPSGSKYTVELYTTGKQGGGRTKSFFFDAL